MRLRLAFLVPLAAIAMPLLGACSGESEGQPCDQNAGGYLGSNDCNSPLQCVRSPNTTVTGYRCCPADLTTATTPECSAVTSALDASIFSPPDAGEGGAIESGSADGGAIDSGPAETGTAGDASEGGAPGDASDAGTPPGDASAG